MMRLNSRCVLTDLMVKDHLLRIEDHGPPWHPQATADFTAHSGITADPTFPLML